MSQHPLKQFRADTEMRETERDRYERMIRQRVGALNERPAWTFSWGLAGGGLALAAALLIGVRLLSAPSEPQPLAMQLDGPAAKATLSEHVRVDYSGEAQVSGTTQAPIIQLSSGRVEVDVDHGKGIDLRVRTAEAEVKVLGTIFSVERGPLGSTVDVKRGKVGVSCADGSKQVLEVGQSHTCAPTDPAGLLGRARALQAQGASGDAVLAATDAGLAQANGDPGTRGELLYVRLEALTAAQNFPLALEAAKAYLDSGETARRADTLEAAARLALLQESCAASQGYLNELEAMGQASRTTELRSRCPAE